eukprot:1194708-Prorocentrum_minimum.AAC.8
MQRRRYIATSSVGKRDAHTNVVFAMLQTARAQLQEIVGETEGTHISSPPPPVRYEGPVHERKKT